MKFEWIRSLKFKISFIFFIGIAIAFGINWFIALKTIHAEKADELEKVLQHLLIESTDEYISIPLTPSSDVRFLYTIPHNKMILSDSEVSNLHFVVSSYPRMTQDQIIASSIKLSNDYYLNAISDHKGIDTSVTKYSHKLFIRYFFSLLLILIAIILLLDYYMKPLGALAQKTREWKKDKPFDFIQEKASSEIKEVSYAFASLVKRLEEYRRKETELFKEAAHELKTPLALMRSRLDVYEQLNTYEKSKFIADMAQDLERLTNELKNVLFLESSDFEESVLLDVHHMFSVLQSKMAILIQRKKLTLTLADQTFLVEASETLIYKVFGALIENAITYALEDSIIEIKIDGKKRTIQIGNISGNEKYLFSSKIGNKMLNRLSEEIGYTYHIEKNDQKYSISLCFRDLKLKQ